MSVEINWHLDGAQVSSEHDLLIVALGYEERSSHVAKQRAGLSASKFALSFPDSDMLSFASNKNVLSGLGFSIIPMEADIGVQIAKLIAECQTQSRRVGLDISSLTRLQLAQVVDALLFGSIGAVELDFLYSPAKSEDWSGEIGPITIAQPVHPAFTAWTDDPMQPLVAIIGVGVEDNLSLGVAEFLDVSSVYAFVPTGGDPQFDILNNAANYDFLETSYVTRRLVYDLRRPFEIFARLESLIYGIGPERRIAVVPLGPKIFALCSLLASAASERSATVWRFSSGSLDEPSQREPAGQIVSLHLSIGQSTSTAI